MRELTEGHDLDYLALAAACRLFPGAVHPSTLSRYITKGSRGVHLRAVRSGGRWFTTKEWVEQFLAERTRVELEEPTTRSRAPGAKVPRRGEDGRIRESERARERLRAKGFAG